MFSGLSGRKVEPARQILQKVDQTNVLSIDRNSGRLMLHGRGRDLTVFVFLNDSQTTTKNLVERILDIVRRSKLSNVLLEDTHAKRVATKMADQDDYGKNELGGCSAAKWLQLYSAGACCYLF